MSNNNTIEAFNNFSCLETLTFTAVPGFIGELSIPPKRQASWSHFTSSCISGVDCTSFIHIFRSFSNNLRSTQQILSQPRHKFTPHQPCRPPTNSPATPAANPPRQPNSLTREPEVKEALALLRISPTAMA